MTNKKEKTDELMVRLDQFHKFYSDAWSKLIQIIIAAFIVVGVIIPILIQFQQWGSFKDEADDLQQQVLSLLDRHTLDIKREVDTRVVKAEYMIRTLEQTVQKRIGDMELKLAKIEATIIANADAITLINEKYGDLITFIDDKNYQLALRMARAEDVINLVPPFRLGSPVQITHLGHQYLQESGLNDLLAKYYSELTSLAKTTGLSTPEEVEQAARYAVNTFEWGDDAEKVDNYMLSHPDRRMFNIWEIAAIRFKNMLLEDLGMEFPPEPQENPLTDEKTSSPL